MANQVYANMMEVSCKAASGKSICAFPDVCFTPPTTPATPPGVPIPYPNTGMASDCTDGSSTVKISGQEVMLKNKSYFKRSMGDEAGCAPKKGAVTSKNMGKVYFTMWSMDVKVEGENVVRMMDLTTHNHACLPANTAPWTYLDRMALGLATGQCQKEAEETEKQCGKPLDRKATCPPEGAALMEARSEHHRVSTLYRAGQASKADKIAAADKVRKQEKALGGAVQRNPCQKALRCFLVPYRDENGRSGCCPGQTPDHLIEAKAFILPGESRTTGAKRPGWSRYDAAKAPCLCAEGGAATLSTHGVLSAKRKAAINQIGKGKPLDIRTAASIGAATAADTFRGCSAECIEAQLLKYHENVQDEPGATVAPPAHGMGNKGAGARGVSQHAQRLAERLFK